MSLFYHRINGASGIFNWVYGVMFLVNIFLRFLFWKNSMKTLLHSSPRSLSLYISHITSFLAHPRYSFQILLIATWCVLSAGCRIGRRRKRRERWASWSLECIKILPVSHTHALTLSSGNLARVTWDFGAEGSGPRIIICSQAGITGPPGAPRDLGPVSQHSRSIFLTVHPDSLTDRHSPHTPAKIASLLHFWSARCHRGHAELDSL